MAEGREKLDGFPSKKVDHSLVDLERMVDYCIKPGCKRKYILNHFGEKIDASIVCKRTCDYCCDPKKVEMAIRTSECMTAVVDSHRLMHSGKWQHNDQKLCHHNPLASDESQDGYESDGFTGLDDEGLLGCNDNIGDNELMPGPKGFMKASSVLSKYEVCF